MPVTVPLLFPILALTGAGLFCVALRFFGFVFVINLRMSVGPFWAKVCIVNGKKVMYVTGDTKRTLIL